MDKVFKDLEIKDAVNLIHYELPAGKQEAFGERYMSMWSLFPDVTAYTTQGAMALESKRVSVHIIV
jgi:hypothetical protein